EANASDWLLTIDQLFQQTDRSFSVYNLPSLEERQRKTVLAKVQRRLNETLTKEWQTFRLDERDALKISMDFYQQRQPIPAPIKAPSQPIAASLPRAAASPAQPSALAKASAEAEALSSAQGLVRSYIKLDVVETDSAGDEHFFFISDRSKGFYWFFNFVMKLEFNPKVVEDNTHTIYLLDEPGSYLHAFAQRKLCQKLRKLSESNRVIYCTHSHYLLDPEKIPLTSVSVADKDGNGNVSLVPIANYRGAASDKRSALQPVLDALQIRPFALDVANTRATVITEGIYDYLAIELFRNDRSISVLPSVGAESIKFYVSYLIAWQVEFRALWDNDDEGRKQHARAVELFGPEVATRNLRLLPAPPGAKKWIMQNLFDGADLVKIRTELELSPDCSFERAIHALSYSPRRTELVQAMSQTTKQNFEQLFGSLSLPQG
ncbi:MAG: ATP-dependent nuclease, partial [Bryobacteraceae bacterium]